MSTEQIRRPSSCTHRIHESSHYHWKYAPANIIQKELVKRSDNVKSVHASLKHATKFGDQLRVQNIHIPHNDTDQSGQSRTIIAQKCLTQSQENLQVLIFIKSTNLAGKSIKEN